MLEVEREFLSVDHTFGGQVLNEERARKVACIKVDMERIVPCEAQDAINRFVNALLLLNQDALKRLNASVEV